MDAGSGSRSKPTCGVPMCADDRASALRWLVVAALMLAGIFGPIALKTQLRRIPVLDRLSN